MAITRRQFIKRTGLATASAMIGPGFFRNPFLRRAMADQLDALDRYFVVVYLDGGNDGLNTVIPYADGPLNTNFKLRTWYEQVRSVPTGANPGGIQLTQSDLQNFQIGKDPNTGSRLALHPGLAGLWNIWKNHNALAVVQGCGDPNSLNFLSHEFSRTVWQSANPFSNPSFTGGWIGRYLGANYQPSDIPAVCIQDFVPGEFQTSATSVLTMFRVGDFSFPYDDWDLFDNNNQELNAKHDAVQALFTNAKNQAQSTLAFLGTNGSATLGATDAYPQLDGFYTGDLNRQVFDAEYQSLIDNNGNGVAADLREVAKIIFGVQSGMFPNVKARAFQISNGGYDTHSNQGTDNPNDQQFGIHQDVGDALNVFYEDCLQMGVANKLCVIVWSEFSRRIQQNDSGTDHGSQGPVFVIGGTVKGGPSAPDGNGGVYGNHPNINTDNNQTNSGLYGGDGALNQDGNTPYLQANQDPNDPVSPARATDFRDLYGTILKHWMNMDPTGLLPTDAYWTAANFNLPFLP